MIKILPQWLVLGCAVVAIGVAQTATAKVNVFTCEPEWKALVEELGKDHVKAFSATTAYQDPHHIEARPSLIAKARRADLVVCTGSELEIGWLPILLRQSGNAAIQEGKPGYFLASSLVERLEVPETLSRSMGDIHASGNPHVHLDPYRLQHIARSLAERLQAIDPEHSTFYQQQFTDFNQRWSQSIKQWEVIADTLKGKKAVVYHRNWSYLLSWLAIDAIADLEPKPGLPPTSAHLVSLLKTVKEQKPDFILVAAYQDTKSARWLSEKSAIPVVSLPFTVGGNKKADNLFALYQNTLSLLSTAGD